MHTGSLTRFHWVSLAEGVSFLVLQLIAMPLKYLAGMPVFVSVVGMLHGLLFIAYCLLTFELWRKLDWSVQRTALMLVAAVLPTGAFFADRSLRSRRHEVAVAAAAA